MPLLLVLALALLLGGCGDQRVTAAAVGPTESVSAASTACVTFGPPPPLYTIWGYTAGHVAGQVVHTENGILVSVDKFFFNGTLAYNGARIEPPPFAGFGAGQNANIKYANLGFGFQQLGWTPGHVTFVFHDPSSVTTENLIVNGDEHIGALQNAPAVLGGVAVTVAGGVVTLAGPVTSLKVGGQKLWIDELCAAP